MNVDLICSAQRMAESLHYCKYCRSHKPFSEMRKDKRRPDGVREQCLACRSAVEKGEKKAPVESVEAGRRSVLYRCSRCEQLKPADEMAKDRRRSDGIDSRCKLCRRKTRRKRSPQRPETSSKKNGSGEFKPAAAIGRGDEWAHCWKCNKRARPHTLLQIPDSYRSMIPDPTALLCRLCIDKITASQSSIEAERQRAGLPTRATRDQVVSRARTDAAKMLIENHMEEYRRYYEERLRMLGGEMPKKWVTL